MSCVPLHTALQRLFLYTFNTQNLIHADFKDTQICEFGIDVVRDQWKLVDLDSSVLSLPNKPVKVSHERAVTLKFAAPEVYTGHFKRVVWYFEEVGVLL